MSVFKAGQISVYGEHNTRTAFTSPTQQNVVKVHHFIDGDSFQPISGQYELVNKLTIGHATRISLKNLPCTSSLSLDYCRLNKCPKRSISSLSFIKSSGGMITHCPEA